MKNYNPKSLMTNCGFCSIAVALELYGQFKDADTLYEEMLQRLHIVRQGDNDPIPRQLIFKDESRAYAQIPAGLSYGLLEDGVRSLSDYTLTAVAEKFGLQLQAGYVKVLNQYIQYVHDEKPKTDRFKNFAEYRIDKIESSAKLAEMLAFVKEELMGHSIIGMRKNNSGHFVNLEIDGQGEMKVFDSQVLLPHDGAQIHALWGPVYLYERIRGWAAPPNPFVR